MRAVARDHLLRVIGLKLIKLAPIDQAGQHVAHVVGDAMVRRHDVVDIRKRTSGRARLDDLELEAAAAQEAP